LRSFPLQYGGQLELPNISDLAAFSAACVGLAELRWADGVHLDERSAVIVAQVMERALASARGAK
jgi:hypothetical protein